LKKEKTHIIFKNLLFGALVTALLLPLFQHCTGLIRVKKLHGFYETVEAPKFSSEAWFSGSFQSRADEYLNQHFGFRPSFIRLYNQLYYTFFTYARANGVLSGKSGYLYEKIYIEAHLGRDFIGQDQIQLRVDSLAMIRDTLAALGKDMVIILAPGKASFYPEFIPEQFEPEHKTITNYEAFSKAFKEKNIPLLDFKSWFLQMKPQAQYPLFPKNGIHWSKYGEALVADSLLTFIGELRQTKMPKLIIDSISLSTRMRDTDDDIEKGMNLIFDLPDLEMAYPHYRIVSDSTIKQPKVLVIADSYYWGLFGMGLSREAFDDGDFWYYNEAIHPTAPGKPQFTTEIDYIKELGNYEVILLLSTDANLYKFPFGFSSMAYPGYFLPQNPVGNK